jgi:hypothetical protein
MRFTVKVRGTVAHGEWDREELIEGRSSDSIAAALSAYPRKYDVDADSTQDAAEKARETLAADEAIDEPWMSHPDGGADVSAW